MLLYSRFASCLSCSDRASFPARDRCLLPSLLEIDDSDEVKMVVEESVSYHETAGRIAQRSDFISQDLCGNVCEERPTAKTGSSPILPWTVSIQVRLGDEGLSGPVSAYTIRQRREDNGIGISAHVGMLYCAFSIHKVLWLTSGLSFERPPMCSSGELL
jgi:hypothetical protein